MEHVLTFLVLCTQASFLAAAYGHAGRCGDLAHFKHISAVLDDSRRSRLCGFIGVLSLWFLVLLELTRELPMLWCRLALAVATGIGIVLTCAVRESHYAIAHRIVAALAFGSGTLLVWVIAAMSGAGTRGAMALGTGLFLTGAAQACNLLGECCGRHGLLPSHALGTLEILLVLGFGAIAAPARRPRPAHSRKPRPRRPLHRQLRIERGRGGERQRELCLSAGVEGRRRKGVAGSKRRLAGVTLGWPERGVLYICDCDLCVCTNRGLYCSL